MSRQTIFYGAVINPVSLTKLQALPRCLLAVSASGSIDWVVEDVESTQLQEILAQKGLINSDIDIIELKTGQFLLPGFIDTHIVSWFLFVCLFSATSRKLTLACPSNSQCWIVRMDLGY
jgi:hypothetical protein